MDYGLGRIPSTDERDEQYRMSTLLRDVPLRAWRYWYVPTPILNQGATPTCVGHAWAHWLRASPIVTRSGPDPFKIYNEAQKLDVWPGENYDGTSVRGGAKALSNWGHIERYVWAWDVDTLADWILTEGSVVLGTVWTNGMFQPDDKGIVRPTGSTVGGHAYLCIGYNSRTGFFRFVNSWGQNWGQKGRFWMHREDVSDLLSQHGEACAAIEIM